MDDLIIIQKPKEGWMREQEQNPKKKMAIYISVQPICYIHSKVLSCFGAIYKVTIQAAAASLFMKPIASYLFRAINMYKILAIYKLNLNPPHWVTAGIP
jgi:hypothetical protein